MLLCFDVRLRQQTRRHAQRLHRRYQPPDQGAQGADAERTGHPAHFQSIFPNAAALPQCHRSPRQILRFFLAERTGSGQFRWHGVKKCSLCRHVCGCHFACRMRILLILGPPQDIRPSLPMAHSRFLFFYKHCRDARTGSRLLRECRARLIYRLTKTREWHLERNRRILSVWKKANIQGLHTLQSSH